MTQQIEQKIRDILQKIQYDGCAILIDNEDDVTRQLLALYPAPDKHGYNPDYLNFDKGVIAGKILLINELKPYADMHLDLHNKLVTLRESLENDDSVPAPIDRAGLRDIREAVANSLLDLVTRCESLLIKSLRPKTQKEIDYQKYTWGTIPEYFKRYWLEQADSILALLPEGQDKWLDAPDKAGWWWMFISYPTTNFLSVMHIYSDYADIEKHPNSKWLYIPEPTLPLTEEK